jgi:hypothetical protein
VGAALFPPLGVSSGTSLGYRALRIVKVNLLFAPPPLAATAAALGRHQALAEPSEVAEEVTCRPGFLEYTASETPTVLLPLIYYGLKAVTNRGDRAES